MYILDRIENDWAVIEFDKRTFKVPLVLLPPEISEGDVINIIITIDKRATARRKKKISRLADRLFEE